ncbi:MAG: ABC transporter substrate-binding protein [Variibacter sp.]
MKANGFKTSIAATIAVMAAATTALAQTLPNPVVDGETIGTPELVKAACAEGQVIYFTAQSAADEQAIIAPFEKQFSCIKVSIISAVTGRLYERITTEAAAGKVQGDIATITDEALTDKLIKAKLVREWTPPEAAKYPPTSQVKGWWYAASGSLMYPFYNTQTVTAAEAPKTWEDLIDPKWKDKIATSPITIGGTAWMQYAFMLEKFGKEYIQKFVAQQPKLFTAYNPAVMSVARGETVIGISAALNEFPLRVSQGAPTKPIFPDQGVPFTNYPMLLLAGSPHPHAAELFGNWYLSKQGQASLVKVRGAYSARSDVAPAPGNPSLSEVKPWNPGHDFIIKNHDKVMQEVSEIFGRR